MQDTDQVNKLIKLLKTARGQIDAILTMVQEEKYCNDILIQLSAVQGLIKKSSIMILENHIEKCLCEDVKKPEVRENKIKEIVSVIKNCMKS